MSVLPVCRWRDQAAATPTLCRSPKYLHPPNPVSAAFCAACVCVDHEPAAGSPSALPCVHLGASTGEETAGLPIFACALHGRCVSDPARGELRSCAGCADHLPRDPFGPDSALMHRKAEAYLAALPPYPQRRYQGRGVVIAGGGERYFPSLYVTIRALQHVGCDLPIEVWYLGRRNEMPKSRRALLAPYGVECVDADKVRRRHPARNLDGWELKVFATLHSRFEEILFLDADCYPCRDPDFLFAHKDYRSLGAIFWPDIATFDPRLQWPAFSVPDPHRPGSIESGQVVIHKQQCWRPLNLAWYYNDHSDYYYRYCYGDKHTFEVAWTRCAQPFVMWQPRATWSQVAYVHPGPDGRPLFIHRCADKFRFEPHDYVTNQNHTLPAYQHGLPLERECWVWMAELAEHMGRTRERDVFRMGYNHASDAVSSPERIAVATLYTPEIADYGKPAADALAAYADRHGYRAVIATAALDPARPPSWSKLLLLERYLSANPACEWMMWLDADAVITKPMQSLESLLDADADLLVAEDIPPSPINLGVFLVRNRPSVRELLRHAYAKTQYLHHPWWEQPAMAEAIRERRDVVRTRIVPRKRFNAFAGEYHKDDFIIHFAGCSHTAKVAGVTKAVDAARSQCDESTLPIVNGFWMSGALSKLEKLSIRSFMRHGYRYRLWSYAPITGVPDGVELRDAREVIPDDGVFTYRGFAQHQKVQGFSDLFRYRLLHRFGGWWADLDVTLLRPLPSAEYVLAKHWNGLVGNVMHAPAGCPWMAESADLCQQHVGPDNTDWHLPINLMLAVLKREKIMITVTHFGADRWDLLEPLLHRPGVPMPDWDGIHWCNSVMANEKDHPKPGSVYARLLAEYGL